MSSLINIPLAVGTTLSLPLIYKLYQADISTETKFGLVIVLLSGGMASIRNGNPMGIGLAVSLIVIGYLMGFDIGFQRRITT